MALTMYDRKARTFFLNDKMILWSSSVKNVIWSWLGGTVLDVIRGLTTSPPCSPARLVAAQ